MSFWDWIRKPILPLIWLLSLFRRRNNENRKAEEYAEHEDIQSIHEEDKLVKEMESGVKELKDENKTLEKLSEENEPEVFTPKKDYSSLQSTNEELQRQLSSRGEEVYALKSDCSQFRTRNEELQRQLSSHDHEVYILKRDCSQLRTRNEDQLRQLNEYKQQVETLIKDCSQLRTRLSQIAAMQLTEGNPNIADLSDQNRPDKLAEQFSELYDNQWTDCYQVLVGDLRNTEEDSIHILLNIVKTSYEICLDGSQNILKTTKDILFAFAGRSDGEPDKSLDTLIQEVLHKLKSYRTRSFKAAPTNIRKEIKAKLISTIGEPVVDACSCFIEECIRICWLMCIKDPAMYIFCDKEAVFDKTKYMEYTETGREVSYVVWPVLYLHKDGPLMRKGVAQGEGRKYGKGNKNVKAASHELSELDHMQEYHNGIEDVTNRDRGHQANDTSITKETKSEDMESAEITPVIENEIENQSAVGSSGPSKAERKGTDDIGQDSEEVPEHVTETEYFNRVWKADNNVKGLAKKRMEINEASLDNQTDLEQMEESNVISNMGTYDKDDQLEDAKGKPQMRATDMLIVTEELPSKDNQVSTTCSSRVAGVEGNVADSGMKQNAENEMQQTAPIINHTVTESPPLEDMVIEANREDVDKECLKEDKKDYKCEPEMGATDLPKVTEELPFNDNQVPTMFLSRVVGVEGNVVDSGKKQNAENEMQQTAPIINHTVTEHPPLENKVIETNRKDVDKECLKEDKKDYKCEPEMGATDLPKVTEELPFNDNQVPTMFLSRVVGVEGNVVDSGKKQNAENEMQQTAPIINHTVTEHPPLENKVIETNREDVDKECLKEDKKDYKCEPEMGATDLPKVTEELPFNDNQVPTTFLSRVVGVEGNVVDSGVKQNAENEMQQTAPIINHTVTEHPPLENKVIEANREDVDKECLKEDKKDYKCEPEMGATDLPKVTEGLPFNDNQVPTTFLSRVVGVEGNVVDSGMKQNAENEMQQTGPPPLENKVIEDNREYVNEECLKEVKEIIDMGKSQQSQEEENLKEGKHNGSVPSENCKGSKGVCSSDHEASEKNVCDSPNDTELRLKANDLNSSLDDSSNKEKDENELQTSTKGEVTEIEKQADTILIPSDEYCQQKETWRASGINEDKNQREEMNDGSIAWSNDQVGVAASSSFNVPSEKNIYDSLNDDEQGEKLKSNNVHSLSDDSWKHKQEEEDFQATPNHEAAKRRDKADYKLASSKEYCQHMESSGGSSINEEENQGEEKRNGSVACNSGEGGDKVRSSVRVPSTKNICDSPSVAEQEEIPKWTKVLSSFDDSWNEEKEKEGFQSSTKDEATESKEQAENKLVSSDGYCQQKETSRASNINEEDKQGEEEQNGLIECNNGQEVKEATNIVHAPSEKNM